MPLNSLTAAGLFFLPLFHNRTSPGPLSAPTDNLWSPRHTHTHSCVADQLRVWSETEDHPSDGWPQRPPSLPGKTEADKLPACSGAGDKKFSERAVRFSSSESRPAVGLAASAAGRKWDLAAVAAAHTYAGAKVQIGCKFETNRCSVWDWTREMLIRNGS